MKSQFKFICLLSGSFQMDRAAFAYIILCPCVCSGKGGVQATQQAELCFCHTVVFHAILTVFLKIHVALHLVDGFIIQPQRLLQSLLTVTVGSFHDALVVVQISQEFTGSAQRIRPLRLQHGGVGQERTVLLPDIRQGSADER